MIRQNRHVRCAAEAHDGEEQVAGWRRGDEVALAGRSGRRQRQPAGLRERAGVEDVSRARRSLHRDDRSAAVVATVVSERIEGLLVRGLDHATPGAAEGHAGVQLARHHDHPLPINMEDTSLEGAVERHFLQNRFVIF